MKQRRDKGIILVELVLVLTILGILSAISVPGILSQLPKYRLNSAARQIMSDLMWARMQAVSQNNRFKIFFLSDNHQYTILDDVNNNGSIDSGEWTQTKDIQTDYSDVTISKSSDPIFFARGTAVATTITLANPAGTRKVKVNIAGRVKIDD